MSRDFHAVKANRFLYLCLPEDPDGRKNPGTGVVNAIRASGSERGREQQRQWASTWTN